MSRAGQAEILPNLLYSPTGALENRPSHVNGLWIQDVNIDRRFQATLNANRTADSICNSTSPAQFFETAVAILPRPN